MLEVKGLSVAYGKHRALDGASLRVKKGEIVVILGANGAGKSTLLKAIAGICEGHVLGSIRLDSDVLTGLAPHKVVEKGIALVPEGRGVFGDLTVRENLMLGANPERAREDTQVILDRLIELFPKLAERAGQVVRTMSGGEQQMVAVGRAMMSNPEILMLDEPSLGLSPLLSKELFQNLKAVRALGLGILLVEQNARLSLGIADRGYLLENGTILREDRAEVLRADPSVQAAYLGAGAAKSGHKPASTPTKLPPLHATPARKIATVSASQLVGFDINALVAEAGHSARPKRSPTIAATPNLDTAPRADRLAEMLADIEAAAARARKPRDVASLTQLRNSVRDRLATTATPSNSLHQPTPTAPSALSGGKVEVYRRRPGTSLFDKLES